LLGLGEIHLPSGVSWTLYKNVLGIDLGHPGEVYKAVLIRHDIIHRNGKMRNGSEVNVSESDVRSIGAAVTSLAHHIDEEWSRLQQLGNQPPPDIEI
jgi:hypothetical protein